MVPWWTKIHQAQGRGFDPRPWKTGTKEGLGGASGATGYRVYSPKEEGEKGVVVGACVFLLIPDTFTLEAALTLEREDA